METGYERGAFAVRGPAARPVIVDARRRRDRRGRGRRPRGQRPSRPRRPRATMLDLSDRLRPARRDPRRGLLDGPRRAVLHDAARGPRCGRRQGRAARGRRDARLGPAVGRRRAEAGTRTAAYYLAVNRNKRCIRLDLQTPDGGPRCSAGCCADADVLVENFRVGGFERLGFGDEALRGAQPAASSTSRSRATGRTARRPKARLRLRRPGRRRADVDHRRARRRGRRPDQGRRGDQRRRHRAVRRGRRSSAALLGRERAGPRCRPGQRIDVSLLGATLAGLVNQAQNAFVTGRAPGPARQRPPEHRPVRDVRDGRWRARRRGRARAPVAAPVRGARAARPRRRPALRDQRRPGRQPRRAAADPGRAVRRAADGGLARGPRRGRDPVRADQRRRRPRSPRHRRGPRDDGRRWSTRPGAPSARSALPFELSATPASIRTAPPLLGEHTDAMLGELGYTTTRSSSSATAAWSDADAPAQSSWRRNDQADQPERETDQDESSRRPASHEPRSRPAPPSASATAGSASRPAGSDRHRDGADDRQDEQRHEPESRPRRRRSRSRCCRGT